MPTPFQRIIDLAHNGAMLDMTMPMMPVVRSKPLPLKL